MRRRVTSFLTPGPILGSGYQLTPVPDGLGRGAGLAEGCNPSRRWEYSPEAHTDSRALPSRRRAGGIGAWVCSFLIFALAVKVLAGQSGALVLRAP